MDTVKQTVTAMRIYVYFLYYISVEIQRSGNDKSKGQAESRSTGKTSSNMGKLEWDWDMMWSQVMVGFFKNSCIALGMSITIITVVLVVI